MKIRICTVSDIHLGHKRNSAERIIRALYKNLLKNPEVAKCDMLVIVGDLFDRLLESTSPVKAEVFLWFADLCKFCATNDIILRVLEGTPLHDWKQAEILSTIYEIADSKIDYKYVKTLSIEYFEQYNINVLYIPDEWRHTGAETLVEVKELLKSRGLEKVDFGFFHGCFDYQLPTVVDKTPHHDSGEYLKLVSELIFIGHHHTFSRFDRIVAQGSFDRLSHNQEEPKGFAVAHVDIGKNRREVYFIENKDAMIYKTVNCENMTLEDSLNHISKIVETIPEFSQVRVEAEKDHPLFVNMETLVKMFPTLWWSKKTLVTEKDDLIKQFESTSEVYKAVTISKDNIVELVMNRPAFQNLLSSQITRCIKHLKEAI